MTGEENPVGVVKDSPIPDDAHNKLYVQRASRVIGHQLNQAELAAHYRARQAMIYSMRLMSVPQERKLWKLVNFLGGTAIGLILAKTLYWMLSI